MEQQFSVWYIQQSIILYLFCFSFVSSHIFYPNLYLKKKKNIKNFNSGECLSLSSVAVDGSFISFLCGFVVVALFNLKSSSFNTLNGGNGRILIWNLDKLRNEFGEIVQLSSLWVNLFGNRVPNIQISLSHNNSMKNIPMRWEIYFHGLALFLALKKHKNWFAPKNM